MIPPQLHWFDKWLIYFGINVVSSSASTLLWSYFPTNPHGLAHWWRAWRCIGYPWISIIQRKLLIPAWTQLSRAWVRFGTGLIASTAPVKPLLNAMWLRIDICSKNHLMICAYCPPGPCWKDFLLLNDASNYFTASPHLKVVTKEFSILRICWSI